MENAEISSEGYSLIFVAIIQNLLRLALFAFYGFLLFVVFDYARKEQRKQQIKQVIINVLKIGVLFIKKTRKCLKDDYQIQLDELSNDKYQIHSGTMLQKMLTHPIARTVIAVSIQMGRRALEVASKVVLFATELMLFLKNQFIQFAGSEEIKRSKMLQTLKCPLSRNQLVDPVLINQCGHTFQRSFIEKKLAQSSQCPICKVQARRINLKQNYAIKQIMGKLSSQQTKPTKTIIKDSNNFSTLLTVALIGVIGILLLSRPSPTPITVPVSNNLNDLLLHRFNIVDKNVMPLQQFLELKNQVINLFNGNNNVDSRFVIYINGKTYQGALTLEIVKEEDFYAHYKVKGSQLKGSWSGNAYLLTKKGGLYFWMQITQFQGKPALEKLQQDLIYESYLMKAPFDQIRGKWYYLGHITDPNLSGDWKLFDLSKTKVNTEQQKPNNKIQIKQVNEQSKNNHKKYQQKTVGSTNNGL